MKKTDSDDILHEKNDDVLAKDEKNAIDDFKVFIEGLFEHKDTPRKSFSESDLLQALKHYDIKEIQEFVEYRNNLVRGLGDG